jgi:hypothetical protein
MIIAPMAAPPMVTNSDGWMSACTSPPAMLNPIRMATSTTTAPMTTITVHSGEELSNPA